MGTRFRLDTSPPADVDSPCEITMQLTAMWTSWHFEEIVFHEPSNLDFRYLVSNLAQTRIAGIIEITRPSPNDISYLWTVSTT